jgi:tight adherence protein B
MPNAIDSNILPIITLLVFVSVILMFEAVYLIWRSRRGREAVRVQHRLELLGQARTADAQRTVVKQRRLSAVASLEHLLRRMSLAVQLEQHIAQSGLRWTVARMLLSSAAAAVAGFALASFGAQPFYLCMLAALVLGMIPWAYVMRARSKRLRKLEQQLPDSLDLITRAMRAGHSLPLGIQLLADEMPDPIAGEFRIVHEQVSFGVSLQQALTSLCDRVPLTDFRFFVVSVLIQRQSGGNLTEVLGNLSGLIRNRLKLLARVKVLSSEGRMSAWTLGLMPFVIAGVMNFVNPEFMSPFWTDPLGQSMLRVLLTMMLIGILVLRRIVRIRV